MSPPSSPRTHTLKVQPPYFDAIDDGSKPFEVRRNDRAYQTGDVLLLLEWHAVRWIGRDNCPDCYRATMHGDDGHGTGRVITRRVSFVYAGDPRFTGIEFGHVVLGLAVDVDEVTAELATIQQQAVTT